MDTRADGDENTDAQRAINFDGNDEMSVMEESGDSVDESLPSHNRMHSDSNTFIEDHPGPSISSTGPVMEESGDPVDESLPSHNRVHSDSNTFIDAYPGPSTSSAGPYTSFPGPSPPSPVQSTPSPGSSTAGIYTPSLGPSSPFPVQSTPSPGSSTAGIHTPSLGPSSPFPGMCSSIPETSISLPCLSLSRPDPFTIPHVLCDNRHVLCINAFDPTVPPTCPSSSTSSSTTIQMDQSGSSTSLDVSMVPSSDLIDFEPIGPPVNIFPSDVQISINFEENKQVSLVVDESQQTPRRQDEGYVCFHGELMWPNDDVMRSIDELIRHPSIPHPSPSTSHSGLTISELGSSTTRSVYGTYEADPRIFQPTSAMSEAGSEILQVDSVILQSGPNTSQSGLSIIQSCPSPTQSCPSPTQASSRPNEARAATPKPGSATPKPGSATPKPGSATSQGSSNTSKHSSSGFQSDDSFNEGD